MKKLLVAALLALFSWQALAQSDGKTQWQVTASQKEVKIGDKVDIIFTATIDPAWYLYSSDFDPELGPQVTTFTFTPNNTYKLLGGIKAVGAEKKYDDIFEGDYTYFKKEGTFKQTVEVLAKDFKVQGLAEYQVCSDETGLCIQGEYKFNFSDLSVVGEVNTEETASNDTNDVTEDSTATEETMVAKEDSTAIADADKGTTDTPVEEEDASAKNVNLDKTAPNNASSDLWGFLLLAFGGGLLALLTPCVYPMIPMTVTLFMKGDTKPAEEETPEQARKREQANRRRGFVKAMVYGVSIVAIYGLLGLVVSLSFGIEASNFLSTHWLPNVLFFFIFLFFGASFLGMFDLVLPNSWVNKIDKKADRGGYGGVFFMAFTLVLVSFSCTAPIAGSLILASINGEVIRPVLGMIAFSSAFALPFVIFAMFPTLMKTLPKSGGWLNGVKVFLGFLELALAFKFLSTADLAYHWGILDRDIFVAIWVVIFALLGFYLLGKIQLPHDTKLEKIPVPRLLLATLVFSFVVYLVPGLFGANLKLLAGIVPPQTTHNFDVVQMVAQRLDGNSFGDEEDGIDVQVKYASFLHLPHDLEGFFDYEQGLAYAKKVNKPIFLDFTGHGCANCRKMEEYVWSDPRILEVLREQYVIISLYVDDKTLLPEEEWYTSKTDGEVKKTMGKKNLHLQADKFNAIAQPYYVLMAPNEQKLVATEKGYDADKDKFLAYLEKGVAVYKQKYNLPGQLAANQK
ncbi:MAG: cytochrome c biogenesis protein CcdA [Thermonemataceae bacterium]